ncbi:hypothetical protein NS263_13945 [Curtobacterium oceanosedimentum]|uniref:Uncharacterized protein n=1 Tax=Curtobacterium oceanosedimentum TaxID=465820 RepID=A0ABR5S3B4_9MICO|nr:hypothetical protein [Curtobacterium oceanosedimentum]KTR38245.1 hypothetical protein NS263_13945 [Curtobacterium oceanosedimentum]
MPSAADISLTEDEVGLLRSGLNEWSGSANLADAPAKALGFTSTDDFFEQSRRVDASLDRNGSMPIDDWRRTLLATEVVFASDIIGSGIEWETTTGVQDAAALQLLRSLQRKLAR